MAAPDLSVFDRIRTKADYDREEEMFQLKRAAVQQAKAGNLPAALQIADRLTQLRTSGDPNAQQQIQDVMMAQKMLRVDPGVYMDQGVAGEIPNYGNVVGGIEGAKSGYKQQAQKDVDLDMNPKIVGAETEAKSSAERDANRSAEFDSNTKVLPVIEELRAFNNQSPSIPYAGKTQVFRRLMPGTSPEEAAVDLMKQSRIDLAAPLAKQLGVNPTDKDFQASLDGIFDIEASKESRAAQIDALQNRINARQQQIMGYKQQSRAEGNYQAPALDPRNIPMDAVRYLKQNPDTAAQFDEMYGAGASKMVIGP